MYQGLKTKLTANNIIIISPNSIFEQYISNVLPELGEDNIVCAVFDDLLGDIIKDRAIEPRNDFLEHMIADSPYKNVRKRSMEWKTSKSFQEILDRFLQDIPYQWIEFDDIYYEGSCIVSKETLKAKFTILGDMHQTLEKKEDLSLYHQIRKILNKKKASLVTLEKSFRCTNEILEFSLSFLPQDQAIKSFNRNGAAPQVLAADSAEAFIDAIGTEVTYCLEQGFRSIGLICKTQSNSARLWETIKSRMNVQLIGNETVSDLQGVFIIPVYMAKGLEFDAVIICDADSQNYRSEDDKSLLYVACTRALHKLSLFCENEISPLIQAIPVSCG